MGFRLSLIHIFTGFGTRIRLEVIASVEESEDEEERVKTIIPFQIAYAVSIHKAQGLEYRSVKIIIPSYNAEKISHSIFYTAITLSLIHICWNSIWRYSYFVGK